MSAKAKKNIYPLTWAEIDLAAIKSNFAGVHRLALKTHRARGQTLVGVLAVIKADAYGHGMPQVASLLDRSGVAFFGVSDVREGMALRRLGIKKPILLFESTLPVLAKQIVDFHLTPTVCTNEFAKSLNDYARTKGAKVDIHVKVDTGMGRLGIWHQEALAFIDGLLNFPYLSIKGIYTHFPSADTDKSFTKKQIKQLSDLIKTLDRRGLVVPYVHAANSMGLADYPAKVLNLARAGLMLYGLYPSQKIQKKIKLRPAMTVKSRIIFLKKISRGRSISYGRTFIARKNMTVATLPIGYNDGYGRCFSNKAAVLVQGKRCRVLGRVTMDQIMIDVTKVKTVKLGDIAVILGRQGQQEISAEELSRLANTINYEIVCNLGNRLSRVYVS
ncbi:MAG: alanine racemase [Omnitrophica WOR_2 bacterium RIFCSPHIGHO2_02_FULL_48_11]|nr:MAG: alanine racemase [Omnitrophica WOR_2 bacterium RIFCSPHIGHO2_02_FULL_48_11]